MPINKKSTKTRKVIKDTKDVKKSAKKTTDKIVLSSFFKTITIDGKTELVTSRIRRTLFFDHTENFPFAKIKKTEVAKNERDSIPNNYLRYAVLLHLNNGKTILVDEIGESSSRGGFKEMRNLGKRISMITGKELVLCDE
ncbi:MAG: hypothetical protein E3K37_13290 [Candidatus Kuenenia sp.]|nr:hypothetical protein [Candidatus Kuenenia hertensis]